MWPVAGPPLPELGPLGTLARAGTPHRVGSASAPRPSAGSSSGRVLWETREREILYFFRNSWRRRREPCLVRAGAANQSRCHSGGASRLPQGWGALPHGRQDGTDEEAEASRAGPSPLHASLRRPAGPGAGGPLLPAAPGPGCLGEARARPCLRLSLQGSGPWSSRSSGALGRRRQFPVGPTSGPAMILQPDDCVNFGTSLWAPRAPPHVSSRSGGPGSASLQATDPQGDSFPQFGS